MTAKTLLVDIGMDEQVFDKQLQFFDGLGSLGTVGTDKKVICLLKQKPLTVEQKGEMVIQNAKLDLKIDAVFANDLLPTLPGAAAGVDGAGVDGILVRVAVFLKMTCCYLADTLGIECSLQGRIGGFIWSSNVSRAVGMAVVLVLDDKCAILKCWKTGDMEWVGFARGVCCCVLFGTFTWSGGNLCCSFGQALSEVLMRGNVPQACLIWIWYT